MSSHDLTRPTAGALLPAACLMVLALGGSPMLGAQETSAAAASPPSLLDAERLRPGGAQWVEWSPDVFARATQQKRLVLLDVGAGWCHWCHVMDATTYHDPAVVAELSGHYLAVHVDQDIRPDIANRYEDYGWPATVIFDASGKELVKRRGYLPPAQMASILRAVVADPTPGPSIQAAPEIQFASGPTVGLTAQLRQQLNLDFKAGYDHLHAGWGQDYKYLDAPSIEYAWLLADHGDQQAALMAKDTLHAVLALIDPVWGGACQYSVGGDWKEPHYEKIMSVQTDVLRIYALAWSRTHLPEDLQAVHQIEHFTTSFLTAPDGGFYAAQDADVIQGQESTPYYAMDDAHRRLHGVPRVDQHRYARENGWMIEALAQAYASTGEAPALEQAEQAARWVSTHRASTTGRGGFRHDEHDPAGPYLGDTLAMGRAFLELYLVTAQRSWFDQAAAARAFIDATFKNQQGGYRTAAVGDGLPVALERDENVALARWAVLLAAISGTAEDRAMADHAARYLCAPSIAERRPTAAMLLIDDALTHAPLHIVVVGPKQLPAATSLFMDAIAWGNGFKQVEWWDPAGSPLPGGDPGYPHTPTAAYVCSEGACSPPVTHDLAQALPRLTHTAAEALAPSAR